MNKIIKHKKIAGDCGAGDFFHASAFSNACEENLAGIYEKFLLVLTHFYIGV